MKKASSFLLAVALSACAAAAPVVKPSSVVMTQDDLTHRVSVVYELENEPAIVTLDFQTNCTETGKWVSIGARNFTNATNVGRLVEPGAHMIAWDPVKVWPDHKITGNGTRAVVTAWATNAPPEFMAVDLTTKSNVVFYAGEEFLPYDVTNTLYKTDWLLMRKMHAAGVPWRMGADPTDSGWLGNEKPHIVTLSEDYYIGVFELTQKQYSRMIPQTGTLDMKPMRLITYDSLRGTGTGIGWPAYGHAVSTTGFLGVLRAHSGQEFDLPTSAQWEFACRGGTTSSFFDGSEWDIQSVPEFDKLAWTSVSGTTPDLHEAGLLKPNSYGLYDIIGNAWEWCLDFQPGLTEVSPDPVTDPVGPGTGYYRQARGGSVSSVNSAVKSSRLYVNFGSTRSDTDTGFRVACPAEYR